MPPNQVLFSSNCKIEGTTFNEVHSETITQEISVENADYMTWNFNEAIPLQENEKYAFDIQMVSSSSGWMTGIPYIYYSGNNYSEGTAFRLENDGSLNFDLSKDYNFHLDIEVGDGSDDLQIIGRSPSDGNLEAVLPYPMKAIFNNLVTAGTGNITIQNLDNNSETTFSILDPRVSFSEYSLEIDVSDLMSWGTSYGVLIDAGAIKSIDGEDFAGIQDPSTWSFTLATSDPLIDAATALKDHILGTSPLTGPEIATHKVYIENNQDRLAERPDIITTFQHLINTYD